MSRKPAPPSESPAALLAGKTDSALSAGRPEFSRPLRLSDLERAPRRLRAEASPEERAALAARFGILALEALSFEAELEPWRGGWRARGVVKAQAVQACVVTLEPAPEAVDEPFDRGWLPAKAMAALTPKPGSESEIPLDPELDDPPELLGEEIDLGETAAEIFGLALDPYPRAPGVAEAAAFTAAPPGAEPLPEAEVHPFARLKALKDGEGQS